MVEISLPAAFRRRMDALLNGEAPRFFESYSSPSAPLRRGVRANTLKCSPERLRALFPEGLEPAPFAPGCFYLDAEGFRAGADPLHHAGAYYMQEPSAASAVTLLNPQPAERVLDLCAAPGGKSTQIAAALQGRGLLWSNEFIRSRAQALLQNLERCGVRNAVVSSRDAPSLCAGLPGFFDAVLVDAPCSGEGMFRKEPAALAQWSEDNIRLCAARQQEILWAAADALRPGGRLLYSTCTFAPEENECLVARFLAAHPDFELLEAQAPFGRPGFSLSRIRPFWPGLPDPGFPLEFCRRILPGDGGEGHFLALLRRRGDAPAAAPGGGTDAGGSSFPPGRKRPAGMDTALSPARMRDASPPRKAPRRQKEGALRLISALSQDTIRNNFLSLYKKCFSSPPEGTVFCTGDTVRLLPGELPSLAGRGVLAAGLAGAEIRKDRLEPCHALFQAAQAEDCASLLDLPLEDPRLTAFLRGEPVQAPGCTGWTAVSAAGIVTGFGKAAGGVLKNRYPKGLRLRG
ncbi:MAG TPA: RsmB/NOP family class I SAM-dependent RNA methyltransferase [Firmicutes bacterium]|nr:RsmB/NOP family class I SAM-dependent RNA methyltransferase [Bacillota bacterium]